MKSTLHGFLEFVRQQGVVGLAVGFILGGAVSKVVSSVVNDLINPVLGLVLGSAGTLSNVNLTLGNSVIRIGSFLATALDFIVIALVVYFGVKWLKLDQLDKKKE